jgi:cellulose synthase/poly-beta-1,6-N-acetylglucosamine synthase-like glycosyltransferase
MTWHLAAKNYSRKMNLTTNVTTIAPDKLKIWWRQRNRWALGGLQTFWDYRRCLFRENILGYFIAPFFGLGFLMGLIGIGIGAYLIINRFINQYLLIKFSFIADTAIISSQQVLNFSPTILNFFGIAMFILMFLFTILNLTIIDIELYKGKRFLDLILYMTIYLLLTPIVLITATFKLIRGDMKW